MRLKSRWTVLILALVLLVGGGVWFALHRGGPVAENALVVDVPGGSSYRVTRNKDVMGVRLTELRNDKSQQKVLVLSGIRNIQSDPIFKNTLTKETVQTLGNHALKVLRPSFSQEVVIDSLSNLEAPSLAAGERGLERRTLAVQFHTSTNPKKRTFHFSVGRFSSGLGKQDGLNTLVINYADQEHFQPELLKEFSQAVTFQPAGEPGKV